MDESPRVAPDRETHSGSGIATAAVDLFKGIGHSAIQNTYNGLAQLVDQTGVNLPQMHVFDMAPADGTLDRVAQTVGEGAGMILPYMAVSKLTDLALPAAAADGAESLSLTQRTLSNPIFRAGLSGSVYAGVLTPSSGQGSGFWAARAENALIGGSTFAALTGSAVTLNRLTAGIGTEGGAAFARRILISAVSGVPAGFVNAEGSSLASRHRFATGAALADTVGSFAVGGAVLGGFGRKGGQVDFADQNGLVDLDREMDAAVARAGETDRANPYRLNLSESSEPASAPVPESGVQQEQSAYGLIDRQAGTGKIVKTEAPSGTYTYEWDGDQLTRVGTPHWTFVRDGESSDWLTFSKNGKPHTHSYWLDVENDGTFVKHNLKTNQINRYEMNGNNTVIYSPEGDPNVAQRTLHPDESTTTFFRDGTAEKRDEMGELLDRFAWHPENGPPVVPSAAQPEALPNDPLEELYALEPVDPLEELFARQSFDPHAGQTAEPAAVVPIQEVEGGTIFRNSTNGQIMRTSGYRGTTSYQWNGDNELVGFTLPSGVKYSLQGDGLTWAPSDPTGVNSSRPRALMNVDQNTGALISHNYDTNTIYRHLLNGDIVVQEPLAESLSSTSAEYSVIHPDGSTTRVLHDGSVQSFDVNGQQRPHS